jgi:very-short-patch-repair endonuclease
MHFEPSFDPSYEGKTPVRHRDHVIARMADRQHGVVARQQLLEAGLGPGAIERRLWRGSLHLVHRGVYAVGRPGLGGRGRWMAAVLAGGPGAVLSHRSAGQLWGLLTRDGGPIEITRPSGYRTRRPGISAHESALAVDEIEIAEGIRVTSPSRTLFDLAGVLPKRRLERAVNEAEVRRLLDRVSLPELFERHPARRGTVILRNLLAERNPVGVTRNELEEAFMALIDAGGLPRPRLNAHLALSGRFFEIDCLWHERRLAVELDGRAVHGTQRAFESDRERDRTLLAEGWRTMRVTWRQLRDEPKAIESDLRRLLAFRAVI